jgi:hypothetical protein
MEESDYSDTREDVFSRSVKAGKRTYFFDVKSTRDKELYITITESKKRFDNALAKFVYDKHKIFLYQEDFEKFMHGLQDAYSFIETGKEPPERIYKEVKRLLTDIDSESTRTETID